MKGGSDTHSVGFRVDVPTEWLERHVAAGTIDRYVGFTEEHIEYGIPKGTLQGVQLVPKKSMEWQVIEQPERLEKWIIAPAIVV